MKKMNKVLALLTVMAMLATLFVAVPASASLADLQGMTPVYSIEFTSDIEGETAVDPNALEVGDTFYAWMTFSGITPDVYIATAQAFITWDEDVVEPTESGDEYGIAPSLVVNPDFEDLTFYTTGKGTNLKAFGRYDALIFCDDADLAMTTITESNAFGYTYMPTLNGNSSKSTDEFYQVDETGKFRLWGYAFEKIGEGNVGVTAAKPNATMNGKTVAYPAIAGANTMSVLVCDNAVTTVEVEGAASLEYKFTEGTDNTPDDSKVSEPETPTDPTGDDVTGKTKQASKSTDAPNAFFYEFETPTISGEVTGLSATFQIAGKEEAPGAFTNINLTGISNVALKIAAVVMNIPEGQEDTEITTSYVLTYTVEGAEKTLEWSCTDTLN